MQAAPCAPSEHRSCHLSVRGLNAGESVKRQIDQAVRHIQLAALVEELPQPRNGVTLDSRDKGIYGVPLPRIQYADRHRVGLAEAEDNAT